LLQNLANKKSEVDNITDKRMDGIIISAKAICVENNENKQNSAPL